MVNWFAKFQKKLTKILECNKVDLIEERKIVPYCVEKNADNKEIQYYETNAKCEINFDKHLENKSN